MRILTTRLELALQTPDEVLAWVQSLPPEVRAEVSPEWVARVRRTSAGDPWALSFQIVERASGKVIGTCGFKGPPDAEGMVELAYAVDEPHRCRGLATEATAALVGFAMEQSEVRVVRAHTRPDNAASLRVLAKSGFEMVGEVIDPDDGFVVRWQQRRAIPG